MTVGPRVIGFGQAMLDPVLVTHARKDVRKGIAVTFAVGELDAVVGQDDVDPVGHDCDEVAQKLGCFAFAGTFDRLGIRERRGPIDSDTQLQLAFLGAHLGDVEVNVANGVDLERPLRWLSPRDVRQATAAVALEAAV